MTYRTLKDLAVGEKVQVAEIAAVGAMRRRTALAEIETMI